MVSRPALMAAFMGEPPWKEATAALRAGLVGRIGRGAEHEVLGQLGGQFRAVVLLGERFVDHLRHRRLPHQLRQRAAAEIGHAVDDLGQVRAKLHGADLALEAFQLLLGDAHQLELFGQRGFEVRPALGHRPLDEGRSSSSEVLATMTPARSKASTLLS